VAAPEAAAPLRTLRPRVERAATGRSPPVVAAGGVAVRSKLRVAVDVDEVRAALGSFAGCRGEWSWVTLRARWVTLRVELGDAESSLGDAESSLGDAKSSLGDAKSSLGDAKSSLGDAESSLGDAESSLGDAKSSLCDAESLLVTLRFRCWRVFCWRSTTMSRRSTTCTTRCVLIRMKKQRNRYALPDHCV
jgi:hypothetical protein